MSSQVHGYIKAGIALVVAILAALTTALGTGATDFSDIDTQTWLIALGTVLASGALVAFVQNIEGVAGGIIKAVVGAFGAAVAALITALDDRVLSTAEQVTAISAFVVALSLVYQIPDPSLSRRPVPETVDAPRAQLDVLAWRYECLKAAGYPAEVAIVLADRLDVDLHLACRLLACGASVDEALRILT